MERSIRNKFLLLLLLVALVSSVAPAQSKKELPLANARILDVVSRVEDLGAKVQDIQVKETAGEIQIELSADVLFDFDKADVRPAAREALAHAASLIRTKAKGPVRVAGHTDSMGSDTYNQKLSERRATAVKSWLIEREGLRNAQFVTEGFGEKRPKTSNTKPDGSDDPEGRQKNRRVEIFFKK